MTGTSVATSAFITMPDDLTEDLADAARRLPQWTMRGTALTAVSIDRYRWRLETDRALGDVSDRLRDALGVWGPGYAIVPLGRVADTVGVGRRFLRLVIALLSKVGTPFQPYVNWPLWKEFGTSVAAAPGVLTGTGHNALHLDMINTTRPPDYTALVCVRPDPAGGGANILSEARAAVDRLGPDERDLLTHQAYRYGKFHDLFDVGNEAKPFRVLDNEQPPHLGFVRYTGKMIGTPFLDRKHDYALRSLAEQLHAGQVSFPMERGDLLVIDQHRWLHGREALGRPQVSLSPYQRRSVTRMFLRDARGLVPAQRRG